jgi:hypothetical protein
MNAYLVAPGIRFNDYVFSEPRRLVECALPKCPGVLVILTADLRWSPKPFQPLYFKEFDNNSRETLLDPVRFTRTPHADLFVSVLPLPFSSAAQRSEVRSQLVWAYNPVWQANGCELVQKLDELERKHEEQTTQLRLLLASINRLFEPLPEPRRRPIGFLPPTTAGVETRA